MSFFFPLIKTADFYQLINLISVDDIIFYKVVEELEFDSRGYLEEVKQRRNLLIIRTSELNTKCVLLSILKEALAIEAAKFLYFTKFPISQPDEISLEEYDYIIIDAVDSVKWDYHRDILEEAKKARLHVIMTSKGERLPNFASEWLSDGFKRIMAPPIKFENYKNILLSRYYLPSEEISALYDLSNGDLDLTVMILNMIDENIVSRNLIFSRDIKLIVNSATITLSKEIKNLYDALLVAKNAYLNIIPVRILEHLISDISRLKGIFCRDHFEDYVVFEPKLLELIDFPRIMLERDYFQKLLMRIKDIAERIEMSKEIEIFLKYNIPKAKEEEVPRVIDFNSLIEKIEKEVVKEKIKQTRRGLRWLTMATIKDEEIHGEEIANKIMFAFNPKIAERRSMFLTKIDEALDSFPELVISQFIPIPMRGFADDLIELALMVTHHGGFSPIHNYLYHKFQDFINDINFLIAESRFILLIKDIVQNIRCMPMKGKECIKNLKTLYIIKHLLSKLQPKSAEEFEDATRRVMIKNFENVFSLIDLMLKIERKLKEIKWLYRWKLEGIEALKKRIRKIFSKLRDRLVEEKELRDALIQVVGNEFYNELMKKIQEYENLVK